MLILRGQNFETKFRNLENVSKNIVFDFFKEKILDLEKYFPVSFFSRNILGLENLYFVMAFVLYQS